ncbi:hypothetical protein PIB30_102513, partial [Stylosanthes scabra]|nr:hypothetical protein [Stylosanthes scabra]
YLVGKELVRRGRQGKESSNQTKKTLATHAYACPPRICVLFHSPTPLLLHSSLTHPRICVAFYAYAYPLIHHPAQPSFYTMATLPMHMRALHAYACYHITQHNHTPSSPTIFTLRPPFHAYASHSTHMRDRHLTNSPHSKFPFSTPTHMRPFLRICVGLSPTSHFNPTIQHFHSPIPLLRATHMLPFLRICVGLSPTSHFHPTITNHPRICAVAYAYAWNTSHNDIIHPLSNHGHLFFHPTQAYASHSTHMHGNSLPFTMPSRPHRVCPRLDPFHA